MVSTFYLLCNKSFISIFEKWDFLPKTVALSGEKHNQKTNRPCKDSVFLSQDLQIYNQAINASSCQMEKNWISL